MFIDAPRVCYTSYEMDAIFLSNIESVSDLGDTILKHDSCKNLTLGCNIPEICKVEHCILGVDEAGRGPVLGPMVYSVCYCPVDKKDLLENIGCADSKSLTETKRADIFKSICGNPDTVGWLLEAIAPSTISKSMLRRQKYSLNQLAQDSTVQLIKKVVEAGVYVTEVYVDTVGMPDKYQEKLSAIFPELTIVVAKKADATFPIVSAASICAKVTRDKALEVWTFKEGLDLKSKDFGSGYPNDPVTKTFLSENVDPIFGFPQLVRFSWSTSSKILSDKAVRVDWEDTEDDEKQPSSNTSILTFLKSFEAPKKKSKHQFLKERYLSNTTYL